jgi:hypothetical protein
LEMGEEPSQDMAVRERKGSCQSSPGAEALYPYTTTKSVSGNS